MYLLMSGATNAFEYPGDVQLQLSAHLFICKPDLRSLVLPWRTRSGVPRSGPETPGFQEQINSQLENDCYEWAG